MKDFIILMCSVGAHILSSKGIALGLILLLFWIKGKQLGFNSEKWENYFLELSQKKVLRLTLGVSGIGIVGATLLSYMILNKTGFDYALMIAVIMLCCIRSGRRSSPERLPRRRPIASATKRRCAGRRASTPFSLPPT